MNPESDLSQIFLNRSIQRGSQLRGVPFTIKLIDEVCMGLAKCGHVLGLVNLKGGVTLRGSTVLAKRAFICKILNEILEVRF